MVQIYEFASLHTKRKGGGMQPTTRTTGRPKWKPSMMKIEAISENNLGPELDWVLLVWLELFGSCFVLCSGWSGRDFYFCSTFLQQEG